MEPEKKNKNFFFNWAHYSLQPTVSLFVVAEMVELEFFGRFLSRPVFFFDAPGLVTCVCGLPLRVVR